MRFCLVAVAFICIAASLLAQDRDFLTPNEIDQVREAQDPNDRLLLYVHFAKERIDLLQQYLAKDKPGRSLFIHNTLEDYSKIIEAIDTVSDDALKHHATIENGLVAVLNAEKEFIAQLKRVQDSAPRDYDRYKFVLEEAVQTTSDSHDLAMEDSQKRGSELTAAEQKEKQEREAMMPKKEVAERKKQSEAATGEEQKKKIPSLYKPGEKKPDSQ